VEIEGRADAEERRCPEDRPSLLHPALLLGTAEADEHDRGPGLVDARDLGGVLLFGQRPEGRGAHARHRQSRKPPDHGRREVLRHSGRAAVEEAGPALPRSEFAGEKDHVWTVDTADPAPALQPAHPDERHAVGDGQAGGGVGPAEGGIVQRLHDAVDVHEGDIAPLTVADPPADLLEAGRGIHRVHGGAHHVVPVSHHSPGGRPRPRVGFIGEPVS
jgi:hypothetical protein